jgi:hypothetical protein
LIDDGDGKGALDNSGYLSLLHFLLTRAGAPHAGFVFVFPVGNSSGTQTDYAVPMMVPVSEPCASDKSESRPRAPEHKLSSGQMHNVIWNRYM